MALYGLANDTSLIWADVLFKMSKSISRMGTCPDYQGFLDTFIQSGYTPHDSNTLQPVTVGKKMQLKITDYYTTESLYQCSGSDILVQIRIRLWILQEVTDDKSMLLSSVTSKIPTV